MMDELQPEIQSILDSLPTQSVNAVNRLRQLGRVGVPALIAALSYPDAAVRVAAARALSRLKDPAAASALAEAAADPDSGVRLAAILGLSSLPGTESVEALARTLRADHAIVRDCAARALARRSLVVLREALADPNPVARAAAAHGVGYYARDRESILRLSDMIRDDHAEVRVMAVRALAWIATRAPEALDHMLEALRHPDETVRATAARCLGRVRHPAACEALIAVLFDNTSKSVALEAMHSLGSVDAEVPGGRAGVGDSRAVPILLEYLTNHDADLRVAAGRALRFILGADQKAVRDERITAALTACLSDLDERVRAACATALGETGNPEAVAPLSAVLHDPAWLVRLSAASALGALGRQECIPPLQVACRDEDMAVSNRAEISLQYLRARYQSSLS